jgi:hypothetical protein
MTDTNDQFPHGHSGERKQKRLNEAAKRRSAEMRSIERLQERIGIAVPKLLRRLSEDIEQLTEILNRDGDGRPALDK